MISHDILPALEVARRARLARPNVRYAVHVDGTGVAAWDPTLDRWVQVAGLLIGHLGWASMPYELLVDGKLTHEQGDWREVCETKEVSR